MLRVFDEALGLRKSDAQDPPAIVSADDDGLTIRHVRRGHEEISRLLNELEAVAAGKPARPAILADLHFLQCELGAVVAARACALNSVRDRKSLRSFPLH